MDRPAPKTYLGLNAAALLAAAVLMTLVARSTGYSSLRLLLIGTTCLLAATLAAAAILIQFRLGKTHLLDAAVLKARTNPRLKRALCIVFLVLWCLTWFPARYTGNAYYYFVGFYPLILAGLLASGSALVFISASRQRSSSQWWRQYLRQNRLALSAALIAVGAFAIIALLTLQLRILAATEPYWSSAGVPLLAGQILLAVSIAVLALNLKAPPGGTPVRLDLFVFLLLWAVTAALWGSRLVPESFWVTGPRAPNFEYYPFSDLMTFDLGSQFALIGQGIYNHMFFDRALYMSFLFYLHAVGGQNYQQLMSMQAAIFAVFPGLLYLLGKGLHGRLAGLILASLAAMRGLNSLDASAWVDTSTFKHMLTDFPTAIGLAIFVLLMLRWLELPQERSSLAIWAGGALGLTSLLRPHVLLLLPVVIVSAMWLHRPRWGRGLTISVLTLLGFLSGIMPWLVFGPSSGSILTLYGNRVEAVLRQRYPLFMPTPAPTPVPPVATPSLPAATPSPVAPPSGAPEPLLPAKPSAPFVVSHYLHNLVTAALIFPVSPELISVKETVKGGEEFWRPRWTGNMSAVGAGMLVLNLALAAFGIGAALKRLRGRALLPLAVTLIYFAANSLGRTSGGRYLVPADWVLMCYFAVGLAELVQTARAFVTREARVPAAASRRRPRGRGPRQARRSAATPAWAGYLLRVSSRPLGILLQLGLLGALVPLAGILSPRRYSVSEASTLLKEIEPYNSQLGVSTSELSSFLDQPDAVVLQGRALYPLFYRRGAGAPVRYPPYAPRDYPRMVFMLIGPHGSAHVLLPAAAPQAVPNASDALVLGCRYEDQGLNMVSALAVVLPEHAVSFARSPAAALKCPLPEPSCDDNSNCN